MLSKTGMTKSSVSALRLFQRCHNGELTFDVRSNNTLSDPHSSFYGEVGFPKFINIILISPR